MQYSTFIVTVVKVLSIFFLPPSSLLTPSLPPSIPQSPPISASFSFLSHFLPPSVFNLKAFPTIHEKKVEKAMQLLTSHKKEGMEEEGEGERRGYSDDELRWVINYFTPKFMDAKLQFFKSLHRYIHVCMCVHTCMCTCSGTSLLWTPVRQTKVSLLERCPHFRGC